MLRYLVGGGARRGGAGGQTAGRRPVRRARAGFCSWACEATWAARGVGIRLQLGLAVRLTYSCGPRAVTTNRAVCESCGPNVRVRGTAPRLTPVFNILSPVCARPFLSRHPSSALCPAFRIPTHYLLGPLVLPEPFSKCSFWAPTLT